MFFLSLSHTAQARAFTVALPFQPCLNVQTRLTDPAIFPAHSRTTAWALTDFDGFEVTHGSL